MTYRPEHLYGSGSGGSGSGSGDRPSSSSSGGPGSGFGTFLEEVRSELEFHTEDAESRVVSALSDGQTGDVSEIMSKSGCLPLATLLQTIERLEQFRLVERTVNAEGNVYRLSPSGKRASKMMGLWTGPA